MSGVDSESGVREPSPHLRGLVCWVWGGCHSVSWRPAGEGLFAVEVNPMAFGTLKHNLVEGKVGRPTYDWPTWLPKAPMDVASLLRTHEGQLAATKGTITAFIGGPPCQGFSEAGKRKKNDPRNKAYKEYIEAVRQARPALILLENVRGITVSFKEGDSTSGILPILP